MHQTVAGRAHIQRVLILVPVFAVLAVLIGTMMATADMPTLRAGVILSTLVFISLPLFWYVARSDPEGTLLFNVLLLSFGLKLLAMEYRFTGGLLADALVYNNIGADWAGLLANGEWPQITRYSGTNVLRLVTAFVYLVTGQTLLGISILWSWLGLIGMLLFYKAFVTAFPGGHRRLYMLLILLYPSMLLWTSSLSKDALMMFLAGLATYGLARLNRGSGLIGWVWLIVGEGGMLAIRPHIAAIFMMALATSALIRPVRAGSLTPFIRVAGVVLFLAVSVGVAITAARSVGIENLEAEEVEQFIGSRQTGSGERAGSAFTPIDTSSPLGLALLIPTVLFRPFPWEAHNMNALVAAMEGFGLLALVVYRVKSVRSAIQRAMQDSFLLLAVLYMLMFIYLFSAIANFGIIARQRVMIYPFVFMLIAYQHYRRDRGVA